MFLVNTVMGPDMTSDQPDIVNQFDNCVQHSCFDKNKNDCILVLFPGYIVFSCI